ncbi:MAG: pyridoxal phosphate-dependent aminotransferase [Synergistaceae bacterium]|jgi:cystathionine beta-lyase|nr:pyridoxal phosphate-dependent aminotransferase [Synergistaceae bacterium]
MTRYDFDSRIDRRGTSCEKWDDLGHFFGREDILPFWVADMDFRSAPEIIDALRAQVALGIFGYPTEYTEKYKAAVAYWESHRHGWDISPDEVGFMPGVVTGMSAAINEFTSPGDGVVIQPPVYPPFFREVRHNGRKVVENPLLETEDGYVMDFEHLKDVLKPNVTALLLCSPHNPTSRVWKTEELKTLGEICAERDVFVISDEIHQDLVYSDAKHVPLAKACPELASRLVTLAAPSKTFNIAGLRASAWIASDAKVAQRMHQALFRFHIAGINMMGLAALEAAYTKCEPWLDELLAYLEQSRDFVESFLRDRLPRVRMKHPEGTYIFWLDFRDYGMKNSEITDILVSRARVGLNDGSAFGVQGEGFVRLNIGCPFSQLEEGLNRIASEFGSR